MNNSTVIFIIVILVLPFSTFSQSWTYHNTANGLLDDVVYVIKTDGECKTWVGCKNLSSGMVPSFTIIDTNHIKTNYPVPSFGVNAIGIEVIDFDSQGNAWLGGSHSSTSTIALIKFDGSSITTFPSPYAGSNNVDILKIDASDNIWVSSFGVGSFKVRWK